MKKMEHIYTFSNTRFYLCVKANNLAEAIDYLRLHFGHSWVELHIDGLDIVWNKPHKNK